MRYTVTFDMYIEAENDQHALSKAKMIANRQNGKYDQQWQVTELYRASFGSFDIKQVDIYGLELQKMIQDEEKEKGR
jgi:hypothetical protein